MSNFEFQISNVKFKCQISNFTIQISNYEYPIEDNPSSATQQLIQNQVATFNISKDLYQVLLGLYLTHC